MGSHIMKINDSVSYKQSNRQKMKETGSKGPESWCHICIEQGPRFVKQALLTDLAVCTYSKILAEHLSIV